MWLSEFEMSDVRCLRCDIQFSQSDVDVLEEWELPICDNCIYAMYKIEVKYDGSEDLLEFLKYEVKKCRCMHCYEGRLKLDRIVYGSPIDGYVHCQSCNEG